MFIHVAEELHKRAELKKKAMALNTAAAKEGREFTEEEKVEYDSLLKGINEIQAKLDRHALLSKQRATGLPGQLVIGGASEDHAEKIERKTGEFVDPRFEFRGIADFLRDKTGGVRASLSEGSDLQFVVPSYEVDGFLRAYPAVDPFAAAGASIVDITEWSEGRVPFVLAGDEPSVYAEGSGPTTDESASVVTVRLNDPKKIAFLSKPTEESMEDIPALASALGQEGIRRTYNKAANAMTADLVTSLTSASATVLASGDNYEDVLDLIGAIPSFFASPSNSFMMSRRSLALIRNTRAPGSGVPMFDATTNRLAGYAVIQNDFLSDGKVLFGNFSVACHLRRTGLHFLQLNEAYREQGKVGLRFHQRADWAFFSEAANSGVVDQPLYMLVSDLGS